LSVPARASTLIGMSDMDYLLEDWDKPASSKGRLQKMESRRGGDAFQQALDASDLPTDVTFYLDEACSRCTASFGDWHEEEVWDQVEKFVKDYGHGLKWERPDDSEIGRPDWAASSRHVGGRYKEASGDEEGWYGVDLDGTLAEDTGWKGIDHIGKPVERMLTQVREMLERGLDVRIFTARAHDPKAVPPIEKWCKRHVGQVLPVTNVKDPLCLKIYDDRAEEVERNTGRTKDRVPEWSETTVKEVQEGTDLAVTDAQAEAGNYKKFKMKWQGLTISVENPKNSLRTGVAPDGKRWSSRMIHHYGYILRTEGADGDHVDVFLGPDPDAPNVYVIDQVGKDGKFDEVKAMLGFRSEEKAREGYLGCYDAGWVCGPITEVSAEEFADWAVGDETDKAFADRTPGLYKKAAAVTPTTGPAAIWHALEQLDLGEVERQARRDIDSGAKSKRASAVKRLNILRGIERNELKPTDMMIRSVPVIPAEFRPFAAQGGTFIPGDANVLYKDLLNLRDAHRAEIELFGSAGPSASRNDVYNAVKAVYGFDDPVNIKARQKGVSGFLKTLTGKSGPKTSYFQKNLLGKPQDSVGRATIIVDPDLSLDEVGIPWKMAWKMYGSHVQRRLVQSGMAPGKALQEVVDQTETARRALLREAEDRVVKYSRSPSWHKYNYVAGRPKFIDGDAIAINPMVTIGHNADFDGDQMNVHVPASDAAKKEAKDLLMPSKMLMQTRDPDQVMPAIKHEQVLGLYTARQRPAKQTHVFTSEDDALRAIKSGQISLSDEVEIGTSVLAPAT
jgi:DNA-directed RNA polymerase beta' subunit